MHRPHPLRNLHVLVLAAALPAFAQTPAQPQTKDSPVPAASSTLPVNSAPGAQASRQPPAPPLDTASPGNSLPPAATLHPAAVAKGPNPSQEVIADSLRARKQYQAAIAAYRKIEHPSAVVWNKMGIAYQMMFNMDEAQRCYEQSLKLDRRNAMVLNNLATIYDSSKNYKKAEKLYRKALKINPKSAVILKNLGTNLLVQHKYSKGWAAYEKAAAFDPGIFHDQGSPRIQNPTSLRERGALNYYMARGCLHSGQTGCAIQYLRMALNEGFTTAKKLSSDADFKALRGNPAFRELLAEQQQGAPLKERHP